MNIREAKDEIKAALQAYHAKDETGMYTYPEVRQRPILLMGPPGIGKTAIMEQIARECGVGLVAYTMTHHTRQSAIGLPRIVPATYGEETFSVTEYTLSEIIASVYACMQRTGREEGILFIDEINCVSETLAPVMLQFLQNKTFGNHKVPAGWMIVAAGNPAAYNKSVREFDIVTLDRVRRIDVEADAACWMDYAADAGVHGSILAYLTLRPERFYQIRQEQGEKTFVTARGWEDLSELIKSYEGMGRPVTAQVVAEFLQDRSEAAYFNTYYHIYTKYGSDYGIRQILEGDAAEEEASALRLREASLEERLTAVLQMGEVLCEKARALARARQVGRSFQALADRYAQVPKKEGDAGLEAFVREQQRILETRLRNDLLSREEERTLRQALQLLLQADRAAREAHICDPDGQARLLAGQVTDLAREGEAEDSRLLAMIERAFAFGETAFGEQELFLLVSRLARSKDAAAFLALHPCEAFVRESRAAAL